MVHPYNHTAYTGGWEKENQEFKARLSYILSLNLPAWATIDHVSVALRLPPKATRSMLDSCAVNKLWHL